MGKLFTLALNILGPLWKIIDLVASLFGGWPIFGGLLSAMVAGISAWIVGLGPLAIGLFFFVLAIAMVVFDYGILLFREFKKGRRKHVELAELLDRLTTRGQFIRNDIATGLVDYVPSYAAWVDEVLDAMMDEGFDEYYGFKTMDIVGQINKLRLITMRYSKSKNIKSNQIKKVRDRLFAAGAIVGGRDDYKP